MKSFKVSLPCHTTLKVRDLYPGASSFQVFEATVLEAGSQFTFLEENEKPVHVKSIRILAISIPKLIKTLQKLQEATRG